MMNFSSVKSLDIINTRKITKAKFETKQKFWVNGRNKSDNLAITHSVRLRKLLLKLGKERRPNFFFQITNEYERR